MAPYLFRDWRKNTNNNSDNNFFFFFLIPKYFIEVKALLKPGGVFIPRPTSWRNIGIPECYVNIIWALFFHCTATPALGSGQSVWLDMLDGLKQGCPLSPLFFILAVDPLLYHLSQVPNTVPKCFADDLAVGFRRWRDVQPVFPLIDAWSAVTGLRVNHKKTKFLTTAPEDERPDLSRVLPIHWQAVTFASSYVYLGVLFGASVDKIMVFAPALSKFQARVASFMSNILSTCLSGLG